MLNPSASTYLICLSGYYNVKLIWRFSCICCWSYNNIIFATLISKLISQSKLVNNFAIVYKWTKLIKGNNLNFAWAEFKLASFANKGGIDAYTRTTTSQVESQARELHFVSDFRTMSGYESNCRSGRMFATKFYSLYWKTTYLKIET